MFGEGGEKTVFESGVEYGGDGGSCVFSGLEFASGKVWERQGRD